MAYLLYLFPKDIQLYIDEYLTIKYIDIYKLRLINKESYKIYKLKLFVIIQTVSDLILKELIKRQSIYIDTSKIMYLFQKYHAVILLNKNIFYNNNTTDYLDSVHSNNYIILYIDDNFKIVHKEFKNCSDDLQIISIENTNKILPYIEHKQIYNNKYYCLELYSYGELYYGLSFEESKRIGKVINYTTGQVPAG
jgi:hypothetical protein